MRTYCVLLHIFAVLLLCDYGMCSKPSPSPSPSEMSNTAISATSDSHTTVITTESITVGNDSSSLQTGLKYEGSSDLNDTDDGSGDDSEPESKNPNVSVSGVISSTTHPESTTLYVKPHTKENIVSDSGSLTGGVIILILILILICFLLAILFILRKKARSYSFDLTRVDGPGNDYDTPLRSDQQSYEQTNKDLPVSMNYIQEDKSEEKTNPKANGSAGEKTEQTPTSENDDQSAPEENSFSSNSSLSTPMKKVEFNLDLDLLGSESEFSGPTEAEATDAAQNENNNNVSNAGRGTAEEIFTEISLDEPKEHA